MPQTRRQFMGSAAALALVPTISFAPSPATAAYFNPATLQAAGLAITAVRSGLSLLGIGNSRGAPDTVALLQALSNQMTAIQNTVNFLAEQIVELRQIVTDLPSEVVDELTDRQLNAAIADLSTKLVAYREAYAESGEQAHTQLVESGRLPDSMERLGDRALLAMSSPKSTLMAPSLIAAFKGHVESLILIDAPKAELAAILDRYEAWFDDAREEQWTRTELAMSRFKTLEGNLSEASREILCYYPALTERLDENPGNWEMYRFAFGRKRVRWVLTPLTNLESAKSNKIEFGDVFDEALMRYPSGGEALTNFLQVRTGQINVADEELAVEKLGDIAAPRTFISWIARTPQAETWEFVPDWPRIRPTRAEHYTANYQTEGGARLPESQFPYHLRESITGYRVGLDGKLFPAGIPTCDETPTANAAENDAATQLLYAAVSVAVETKMLELLTRVPASISETREDFDL